MGFQEFHQSICILLSCDSPANQYHHLILHFQLSPSIYKLARAVVCAVFVDFFSRYSSSLLSFFVFCFCFVFRGRCHSLSSITTHSRSRKTSAAPSWSQLVCTSSETAAYSLVCQPSSGMSLYFLGGPHLSGRHGITRKPVPLGFLPLTFYPDFPLCRKLSLGPYLRSYSNYYSNKEAQNVG